MKESHRNVGRITYVTTRDGCYAASVSPTQSGVPRDRSSSPPEGVALWPEGDRCAAATRDRNGAAHAPLSPRGAPPNMDHPSQVGAQADRPRAVKPWGPRPLVPAREPARMSSAFRTPRGTASPDRRAQRRMPSIDRHSAHGEWSDAWRMPSPASIAKRARSVLRTIQ